MNMHTDIAFILSRPSPRRRGFTLVLTLIVLAAITLLVLGLFANVSSESNTATNYDNAFRAQTAVRSGLSRVEALLQRGTWSDDYLVLEHMQNPPPANSTPTEAQWRDRKPVLMLARANVTGDTSGTNYTATWEYTPLTSGVNPPPTTNGTPSLPTTALTPREDPNAKSAGMKNTLCQPATGLPKRLPWQPAQDSYWEVIYEDQDDDGNPQTPPVKVPVSRYCFQVEDLQGLLSLDHAGNPGDAIEDATGMLSRPHEREKFEVFQTAAEVNATPRRWYAGFAPGLRTPDDDPLTDDRQWVMSQAALYSLIDPTATTDTSTIDNQIMVARHTQRTGSPTQVASLLLSPDSWKPVLMKGDIANPWPTWLKRNPILTDGQGRPVNDINAGRLPDSAARRIEENTITGLKSYFEYALVPVDPKVIANPRAAKLNLNRIIEQVDSGSLAKNQAVEIIAQHIQKHLPTPDPKVNDLLSPKVDVSVGFSQRSGAYPLSASQSKLQSSESCFNYLKSLAASIIDYADVDSTPTILESEYRGCDSYPLVNEQFLVRRYESVRENEGRYLARFSVTFMYEFWNMSNRPVQGQFEAEYQAHSTVDPPGNRRLDDSFDLIIANPPIGEAGTRWMKLYEPTNGMADTNKANINFLPNEYKVLATLPVTFEFDVGPSNIPKAKPPDSITTDKDIVSGYRVRFLPANVSQNPNLSIKSNGIGNSSEWTIIDRSGGKVEHNARTCDLAGGSKQWGITATIPGSGYGVTGVFDANNLGDPRAAFFIPGVQALSNYENQASPWGRNIRPSIGGDPIYKTAYPSRWPDKGHDTPTFKSPPGSTAKHPIEISMVARRPQTISSMAPMRISNLGRYFSVTELGNIYDPLFWDPNDGGNPLDKGISDWSLFWDLGMSEASVPVPVRPGLSRFFSGGNTLRIGRPEHRLFRSSFTGGLQPNRRLAATTLLDLFHCGISMVGAVTTNEDNLRDLTGPLIEIAGHINLNTASRDVLRSLVAGNIRSDPALIAPTSIQPPKSANSQQQANLLVDSIVANRPYTSPAQVAEKLPFVNPRTTKQTTLFSDSAHAGWDNKSNLLQMNSEWNDAASEETFARLYNSSTVRSRHFRVFVTGQAVRRVRSNSTDFEVVSTRSRVYHVFVQPIRDSSTGLISNQRVEVVYEQDL